MKNKFKLILLAAVFYSFATMTSIANDDLSFQSSTIELLDNGNIILAKDGVEISSNNNELKIYANESKYSKISKQLFLTGEVIIFDKTRDLTIKSNEIQYDKNLELITTKAQTFVNISNNYNISTKNIVYSRLKNTFKSDQKTVLKDNFTNTVETNNFIYYVEKKLFRSKNFVIKDKYLNNYYSAESAIDLKKNEIAAKDVKVYFSENGDFGKHARLKGNSMVSNSNATIIQKGIFTTCKQNDNCPPWSLQSEEIEHDKKKKIIKYKNAWLNFYDVPVFYFPKFFHPDPTVKRQSGFLMPSIQNSTNMGNALKIPYYHVVAENKDFTINPSFFSNNNILVQNEYRQVEKNLDHITDFSIKKLDSSTKSHFFSNTKISLNQDYFDVSQLEINIEKTSNDTYLKSDNITSLINDDQNLLNSYINYESNREDLSFFGEIAAYENLSTKKNSDKFQYILPSFQLSKLINTEKDIKGDLQYKISGSSQKRDTNIQENYLINDFEYSSILNIARNGFTNNLNLMFKNVSKEGKNSEKYNKDFESDNFISAIFTTALPLKKENKKSQSNLTPKLSLRYSPFDSENISNLDRSLNSTNLFSNNRLGLSDSLEGGQSMTIGFDYNYMKEPNNPLFSASLGQIFRDVKEEKLPLKSTMQDKRSDIVGRMEYDPNENFKIGYNFSADNNLETMNYNFVDAEFKVNNFITSFEFLEENNIIGSDSYFQHDISYKFNSNNLIKYNTRRNRKTDLTEFYNLIYEYRNDCLIAAIEYNKDYYEDRDIKPNEEIFFSIKLIPFTSIKSPNFDK
tara:strand:- start:464 stop:2854 length:2391 start_codon:yes stop_codon:yes gene_type:complete